MHALQVQDILHQNYDNPHPLRPVGSCLVTSFLHIKRSEMEVKKRRGVAKAGSPQR